MSQMSRTPTALSRDQWFKVLKGMLIAGAGPALIYGLQAADKVDFGSADMAVAALVSVLVNFVRQVFITPKP